MDKLWMVERKKRVGKSQRLSDEWETTGLYAHSEKEANLLMFILGAPEQGAAVAAGKKVPLHRVSLWFRDDLDEQINAHAQKTFDAIERARSKMTDGEREKADAAATLILQRNTA